MRLRASMRSECQFTLDHSRIFIQHSALHLPALRLPVLKLNLFGKPLIIYHFPKPTYDPFRVGWDWRGSFGLQTCDPFRIGGILGFDKNKIGREKIVAGLCQGITGGLNDSVGVLSINNWAFFPFN